MDFYDECALEEIERVERNFSIDWNIPVDAVDATIFYVVEPYIEVDPLYRAVVYLPFAYKYDGDIYKVKVLEHREFWV